jgi:hypothetical protein
MMQSLRTAWTVEGLGELLERGTDGEVTHNTRASEDVDIACRPSHGTFDEADDQTFKFDCTGFGEIE